MLLKHKPTLAGSRVTLVPLGPAHVDGMLESLADPESMRLTGTHATFTREQVERWCATRADQDDRLDLAILDNRTGGFVGEVVLNDLDVPNRSCNFRIGLVGPRVFGLGFGTEAARLIVGHAFETVGLHRVHLEVYAFNPRARRVYEKVGFVLEGRKRQALWWDGEWVDAEVMSMLTTDYSGAPPL